MSTPEPITDRLRIGAACYHVLHLIPPMTAHEMNFFYDEGLRDRNGQESYDFAWGGLAPFTSEKETLQQAIKERGIDVAQDVKPTTVAYSHYTPSKLPQIKIIAGWRNQQPNYVMAREGISSVADLAGKTVGVIDEKDILVSALSPSLKRAGVAPSDVLWTRKVDPRKGPGALRAGRVDASFVHMTDAPELEKDGFTTIFKVPEEYPKGRPDRIIVATEQALEHKRDQVVSYLKGLLRSYWFIRDMPANFRYVNQLEVRLRRQSYDADERERPLACDSPVHTESMPFPYDGMPTQLENYLKEAVEAGEIDEAPDADSMCDYGPLQEAFSELEGRTDVKEDLERAKEIRARWGF